MVLCCVALDPIEPEVGWVEWKVDDISEPPCSPVFSFFFLLFLFQIPGFHFGPKTWKDLGRSGVKGAYFFFSCIMRKFREFMLSMLSWIISFRFLSLGVFSIGHKQELSSSQLAPF